MDPYSLVRLLVGNLALKILLASKPARSVVRPASSTCVGKIRLQNFPLQTSIVPLIPPKSQFADGRVQTLAASFHLSNTDLEKLAAKSIFAAKPCLTIAIYTGCSGTACGFSSGRLMGKVTVPMDLEGTDSMSCVFHNGWISVSKNAKGSSGHLHLNVIAEPDPRFVFQFDSERECSPQVFQIQGNICSPIFFLQIQFQKFGKPAPEIQIIAARIEQFKGLIEFAWKQERERSGKKRKGWLITGFSWADVAVSQSFTTRSLQTIRIGVSVLDRYPKTPRRFFCSYLSDKSLDSDGFNRSLISELVSKQHWRDLRSLVRETNLNTFLQLLFTSEADPKIVLQYFRWSEKEFRLFYSLDDCCRLLLLLANAKKYGEIRSLLDSFVKNERHSNSSFFHMIKVLSSGFRSNSMIIVDMLILAFVKNSRSNSAIEAFERAGDYGFRLSILSCNPLLNALVKEGKITTVETMFKEMIRRKITPNSITFNTVINGFCKAGKLQKARDLVEDMRSWGCSPSAVTYNTLIDGYCKMGRVGKMYKADALLKEMISSKICPNETTFNILIDGYCKDENTSAAMNFFEEMKRQDLKPNVITYNSIINGLCNAGKLDEALSLQNEMMDLNLKPSIVTYNALINGFSKRGMFNEAKRLFNKIGDQGLTPNVITFNTLIDGYCKFGEMEMAIRLRGLMLEKDVQPNVSTYNCLIAGFCGEQNMEAASKLLDEMADKGVPADLVTYNILIGALCREGESRKAVRLLHEMFEIGVRPSHVTYNTLMDGFCREGNLKAALNLRTQMEKGGMRANVVTYNVLIRGLCQKDKLEEANGLLNEMLEKGLIPNRVTYKIVREEMMDKGFVPDIEGHLCNDTS